LFLRYQTAPWVKSLMTQTVNRRVCLSQRFSITCAIAAL
jgi:hypothetical protein